MSHICMYMCVHIHVCARACVVIHDPFAHAYTEAIVCDLSKPMHRMKKCTSILYIYIYIYICAYVKTFVYIYIYMCVCVSV